MRIVGGRFRGRSLAAPRTDAIRPSSDRLRQALFDVLAHAYEDRVAGARVLDLFAGTGALGLEAMSRGAAHATFVDDSTEARGLLRQNIEALGVAGETRVFRRDATRMGAVGPGTPVDLAFCDPPYGRGLAGPALTSCLDGGWFAPDALVVVEEDVASAFALPAGFVELERRHYGESEITIGRFEG